jgi:hypothetical protein
MFTLLVLVEDLFQNQALLRRLIRHFVVGFVTIVQEETVVRQGGLKLKKLPTPTSSPWQLSTSQLSALAFSD